jgi:hypothetical protein
LGVVYDKLRENEVMSDLLLLLAGAQGGAGDVLVDHRGDRYG